MTSVAATNAELTAMNRARQTVADPTPTDDASSDSSQAFAEVLTATRQTTMMLRRLLDQRVDQISSEHQRRKQAAEAVPAGNDRGDVSETGGERTARADKQGDRSASSTDRSRAARRTSSSDDDSSAKVNSAEESASHSRSEDYQTVTPDTREPAAESTPQVAETVAGVSGYADGGQSHSGGTPSVQQQAAGGSRVAAASGSSSAVSTGTAPSSGGDPFAQMPMVSQPGTASVTAQQTAAIAAGTSIPAPMAAASQTSGGNGTAPDLGQSGNVAKAGQVTARSGAAPAEFQSLMQQAGRTRSAVAAGTTGSATNAAGGEETVLDPSRAESIEKLARVLRSQLGARNSTMTLRLDPPELGNLRVEVRMQDQALTLKFQADTQAGHTALQSKLDTLRQALEQQGVRVEQMSVEYRPQASDSAQQSRDWSNPSSYSGSQSGFSGGFGQAQEQGRGMQESYASASYARWSDSSSVDGVAGSEILTVGTGSMSVSGVDLIA